MAVTSNFKFNLLGIGKYKCGFLVSLKQISSFLNLNIDLNRLGSHY